ncbi:rhodopsin [Trichinella pseudospiralis]
MLNQKATAGTRSGRLRTLARVEAASQDKRLSPEPELSKRSERELDRNTCKLEIRFTTVTVDLESGSECVFCNRELLSISTLLNPRKEEMS